MQRFLLKVNQSSVPVSMHKVKMKLTHIHVVIYNRVPLVPKCQNYHKITTKLFLSERLNQGSRKCGSTGAALLGNGRPN